MKPELWKWYNIDGQTQRMAVPGGWILSRVISHIHHSAIHQVFITDTDYKGEEDANPS